MINIDKLIMDAMKSKDKVSSETYKLIKAKILEFKTQKNAPEYTEEAEVKLLQKMQSERQDSAKIYIQNHRPDLADAEIQQANVIEKLLPALPTVEDVGKYINEKYADGIEQKQMGVVIKEIKSKFIGVDGAMVASLVKSKIK